MATDSPIQQANTIPRLEPGDCLTQSEFERRYSAMPDCKKAELLEGIVYMNAAVRVEQHGEPHATLAGLLFVYTASTPGIRSADNASVRLDADNTPQPDCLLFIDPTCGGRVRISEDDYLEGAPEFVAEIATSSVSYDAGPKRRVYQQHGVQEYLIWRFADRAIELNRLVDREYQLVSPEDDILHSQRFPGLWFNIKALLDGDLAAALETLQQGLATAQHSEFVDQLAAKR
ncbi:MAG: Uma2 family endonuclease [Planctomycetaceae bacterium]